jgi:hypothetical protein
MCPSDFGNRCVVRLPLVYHRPYAIELVEFPYLDPVASQHVLVWTGRKHSLLVYTGSSKFETIVVIYSISKEIGVS